MKYLILIYSNPASRAMWESFSAEERGEGLDYYAGLTESLAASGELIVTEALADASLTKRVTVQGSRRSPATGRSPRPRSCWPASSWSSARARSARSRSPRACPRRSSGWSRCGRPWSSAASRCERAGRDRRAAARARAAGPGRPRPALRRLRELRGRRPGGAARRGAAVAAGGRAGQPARLADHRRPAAADRAVAQRVGPPRRGRSVPSLLEPPAAEPIADEDDTLHAAVPVLPSRAHAGLAGGADPARRRRPDHRRDRPCVARPRGDGGAAHQPRQAADPRRRRGVRAAAAGRALRAARRGAARAVPDLQRGVHRELGRDAAPRRAELPRRSG